MVRCKAWFKSCVLWGSVFFEVGAVRASKPECAYTVLDPLTRRTWADCNGQKKIFPASLAKLMTLYVTFDLLSRRRIYLNTLLRVSDIAAQCEPSKLWVKSGQNLTVRKCIEAVSVRSCNDVATVLAENLAGSVPAFVRKMNRYAQALGMRRTHFCNPSGWHDPQQVSSVQDVALLMRAIWLRFSYYGAFLGQKNFHYQGKSYKNTNKLLGRVPGMCMGKTGFTSKAGHNLSTFTLRSDQPIIVVIAGAENKVARDQKVHQLIERFYKMRNCKPPSSRARLACQKALKR